MNKIDNTIEFLRKNNIEDLENIKKQLIKEVVEKKDLKYLVNIVNVNKNTYNISEDENEEDYEINSYSVIFDGEEVSSEEEYIDILKNDYINISDINIETDFFLLNEEDFNISNYINIENIDIEDIEKFLKEYIENNLFEFFPKFDELSIEYDENYIYCNIISNFDNFVDEENAKKAGLGTLFHKKQNENYMFLLGCGMDMSFCHVKYLAYSYKGITEDYLDKLEWTKQNSSSEEWKEILDCLIPTEYKQYIPLFL